MLVSDNSQDLDEKHLRFRGREGDGGNSQDADNGELHFDG
jgi:hypothetical protein